MNPDSASKELLWTQTQQHKNRYGTQTLHHKNWYGSQVQHHKNWCGTKTQHHKNSSGPRHSNTRIGIGPRHRVTKTGMGARKTIFSSSSLSSFFSFSFFLFHCLHVVLELVWTTRKPLHVIVTYIDLSTTYGTRLYRNSSLWSHSSPSPSSYLVITNLRHMSLYALVSKVATVVVAVTTILERHAVSVVARHFVVAVALSWWGCTTWRNDDVT